ncbi:uncharacterized protein [Anser cygnoides]|uniref:uncharacterized protein n=1 Tax=Anser cygnoides TaxID=8845 RepID=UPI0034D193D7
MRKTNKKDPRAPANVPPQPQPQPRSCQVQPGRAGGGSPGALPAAAPRRRLAAVGGGWRPLGLGAGPRRCLRTDSSGAAAAAAGRRRGEEGARGPAAAAPNRPAFGEVQMPVSSSWSVPEASSHASPRGCYSLCCSILAGSAFQPPSLLTLLLAGTRTFPVVCSVGAHLRPCTRHEDEPHNSQGENERKQTNKSFFTHFKGQITQHPIYCSWKNEWTTDFQEMRMRILNTAQTNAFL